MLEYFWNNSIPLLLIINPLPPVYLYELYISEGIIKMKLLTQSMYYISMHKVKQKAFFIYNVNIEATKITVKEHYPRF